MIRRRNPLIRFCRCASVIFATLFLISCGTVFGLPLLNNGKHYYQHFRENQLISIQILPEEQTRQLNAHLPLPSTTTQFSDDDDPQAHSIELLLPHSPVHLQMDHVQGFVFRTQLYDSDKETFKIYVGRHTNETHTEGKDPVLFELGTWTVTSGVKDYIVLWTPKEKDGLPSSGGENYVLLIKRLSWWGWRKELAFESPPMTIDTGDGDSLAFQ